MVALAIVPPAVLYIGWMVQGRKLLRVEFDKIRAEGAPLTTEDMNALYRAPAEANNITPIWQAALEPFDRYAATLQNLTNWQFPPVSQPLTDIGAYSLRGTLQKTYAELEALHAAAETDGVVLWPHDFKEGPAMLLRECDLINQTSIALNLEFQIAARDGDINQVYRNLRTRVRMADTLATEPILVAMLVRMRLHRQAMRDLFEFFSLQPNLTDAQLVQFRDLFAAIDYRPQLTNAMRGERAFIYQLFHFRFANDKQMQQIVMPVVTTDAVNSIARPEDCAKAFELFGELAVAAESADPAAIITARENLKSELDALAAEDEVTRWRYRQAQLVLAASLEMSPHAASTIIYRDVVLVALAVKRYESQHSRLPQDLAELAPDFLKAAPLDPIDGQPLRVRKQTGAWIVYSLGADGQDDGGQMRTDKLEPDIAVSVPLRRSP
jgi:hypothetical protein